MKPFWVSWYAAGPFEWDGPWWYSGKLFYSDGTSTDTLCAAVMATSENDAREQIRLAHQRKPRHTEVGIEWQISWRFVEEKPADWVPFSPRFPRADWMKWPWPALHNGNGCTMNALRTVDTADGPPERAEEIARKAAEYICSERAEERFAEDMANARGYRNATRMYVCARAYKLAQQWLSGGLRLAMVADAVANICAPGD